MYQYEQIHLQPQLEIQKQMRNSEKKDKILREPEAKSSGY